MTVDGMNEEYFPRGGQLREIKKKRNFVFEKKGINEPKSKKPGRRERKKKSKEYLSRISEDETEEENVPETVFERFESLTYQRLSEGTVALCSVRGIYKSYLDISMPGRLSARLYINNISEPYFKILNKATSTEEEEEEVAEPMERMFYLGQHLSCSVLSVTQQRDRQPAARVSSDPAIVNSRLTFDAVTEGLVLQMAVQSVEDHGYMMFSGISGLISFLPNANASSFIKEVLWNKPLCIGQIVWCIVTKTKLTGSSNTINVSLDSYRIAENLLKEDVTVQKLMPGVNVNVNISKAISQTLMVMIEGSDMQGYIEESQLSTPWSKISDYEAGSRHTASVLFKFPYAKIVALTLKSGPMCSSKEEIKIGAIFDRAEIMSIMKRGVCLKLEHGGRALKGMISVRRIGSNVDYESLSSQFPLGTHVTCRVIGFDALEQVYSCSTEDKVLQEKYLVASDLKIGEPVEVVVETIKKSGLEVSVGHVKAFVPSFHITDVLLHNPFEKIRVKSKYKGKVFKNDSSKLIITLRPTFLKNPSLTDFAKVQVGDAYYGYVSKVLGNRIVVSFFGDLFVHINEQNLLEPPHKYTLGELVKSYVVQKRHNKPPLFSLLRSVQNMGLTVGNKYDLIVKKISDKGITCFFMSQGQQFNGFLPLEHLCDFPDYCASEIKKYSFGMQMSNVLLLSVNEKLPLFTLRQSIINFFKNNPKMCEGIKSLSRDMLLPCSISEVSYNQILVCAPIPGFNGKLPIEAKFLPGPTSSYSPYQGVVARVKSVTHYSKEIKLTCKLEDKTKFECSVEYLKSLFEYLWSLPSHRTGTTVKCRVKEVKTVAADVQVLSTKTDGVLLGFEQDKLNPGEKLKATVLFHAIDSNVVYLHLNSSNVSLCNAPDDQLKDTNLPGRILYEGKYFVLVLVELSESVRSIVFVPKFLDPNYPRRAIAPLIPPFARCTITLRSCLKWNEDSNLHYWIGNELVFNPPMNKRKHKNENNDIPSLSETISVGRETSNDELQPSLPKKKKKNAEKTVENFVLSIPKNELESKKIYTNEKEHAEQSSLNAKTEIEVNLEDSVEDLEKQSRKEKKRRRKESREKLKKEKGDSFSKSVESGENLLEAAAGFDWDATVEDLSKAFKCHEEENLSEDYSEEEGKAPRKLTAREKKAAAAEREHEIWAKEEELLLAESNPQSSEHFDRLLTATPNSSRLWIMYMAHHMQATEIEKARSVAKRALKHINVRLEDERLNVWIASLNLENVYGTPDSFKEVLTEALKYNDDYKVLNRVLDILAESRKTEELEKLVNKLVKKYKTKVECWLSCQEALMKASLPEKARNYLQRSLEALPNKEYCTLISRFALVENKYGFAEQAQSLFENLLTSYPKRTDLWFVYIDMLTKSGAVDLARNVLERATSQKLPIRKMKSLYQKWLKLEESYGNEESVQQVKAVAAAYVSNLTSVLSQNQ